MIYVYNVYMCIYIYVCVSFGKKKTSNGHKSGTLLSTLPEMDNMSMTISQSKKAGYKI